MFSHSLFPIQNKQEKWKMSFPTSHFPPTSMNPNHNFCRTGSLYAWG